MSRKKEYGSNKKRDCIFYNEKKDDCDALKTTYCAKEEKPCKFYRTKKGEQSKVIYLCDRRQCEKCNDFCRHTTDISHAINFENINGDYIETEHMPI